MMRELDFWHVAPRGVAHRLGLVSGYDCHGQAGRTIGTIAGGGIGSDGDHPILQGQRDGMGLVQGAELAGGGLPVFVHRPPADRE